MKVFFYFQSESGHQPAAQFHGKSLFLNFSMLFDLETLYFPQDVL